MKSSDIHITILYFAQTYEASGIKEEKMIIDKYSTVKDLLLKIVMNHPEIKDMLNAIQISINYNLVNKYTIIKEGDEIALLPPIMGG